MARRSSLSRKVAAALGIVTAAGAVFGVILNAQKIGEMFIEWRAGSQHAKDAAKQEGDLLKVATAQQEAKDYAAAWKSLEEAAALAPKNDEVRTQREDLAMAWVRDARLGGTVGPASFMAFVAPLVPVLDDGVRRAQGAHKATLLAHRGWAEFLRERDEPEHHNPSAFYTQALGIDPANPYAHAMLGHWMLSDHQDRAAAIAHFDAAAASAETRPYVRRMELAALKNNSFNDNAAEILRVANAIRFEGGSIEPGTRRDIHSLYYGLWGKADDPLLHALPPDEHAVFYRWLFADDLADPTREPSYALYLVAIEEHAGHRDAARAELTTLRARLGDGDGPLKREIAAALARLGKS